tara:strand:+ start:1336 stop:1944 length:609 start_codon:yes stop_codon:yes gene_type:complete
MNLLPQTELEAVNVMLQNINESPVNSLDTAFGDALMANQMLHNESRKVQSIGLTCNTDYEYTITRDPSNNINLPTTALKVIVPRGTNEGTRDLVQRGQKLYDRKKNTYALTDDVKVTLVTFLEWTDLPQVVRNYITITAARKFAAQVVGDKDIYLLTQQDELEARTEFIREQVDSEQANILTDSNSSFSILHKTRDYPNYGI